MALITVLSLGIGVQSSGHEKRRNHAPGFCPDGAVYEDWHDTNPPTG